LKVSAYFDRRGVEPGVQVRRNSLSAELHILPDALLGCLQDNPLIVVFDIGNVLIRWNPRNLFRKTFRDEARMERFLAAALSMDFIALTDVAADFSQAVAERARAFPEFARELHLFDERWIETIGGPIEENVALMRRLKSEGRPVYALSNFATVKFALARRMYDFLNEFDVCVVSGHVGVVKPDPRIFRILFERAGCAPSELLFVDDSIANVRASEAAGMAAIHYRPGVDLESELRSRGALP
jgi:HAD superfamily hydrolase (TIGR01509 family)